MGGAGGVAMAGGGAWLGNVAAQPAAAPAAEGASGGPSTPPPLAPSGRGARPPRAPWSAQVQKAHGWRRGGAGSPSGEGHGPSPRVRGPPAEGAIGGLSTPPPYAPSGRGPRHRRATWSEQFQKSHGWSAGGAGTQSAEVNDSSQFVRGTQAVRVTTNGSGKQSYVRRSGMDAMDLSGKMIRLLFRVDDVGNLAKMVFYLGSGSLKNHFAWTFHAHSRTAANYVQSGEWVTVHLQWADVTAAAGEYSIPASGKPSTRTGFTDMSFAVYDDAGGPVTYRVQAVELIPDTADTFPKGVVSITFDDSHKSIHDLARPIMDSFGFPGTSYNI